jgi:hypothetical protein
VSAADVQFLTIEGAPCPADQKPARFTFRCVGFNRNRHPKLPPVECGNLLIAGATNIKRDGQGLNGGRPQWDWDGNREAPTFSPSINCEADCGWHGYLRKGRCVSTSGADEP